MSVDWRSSTHVLVVLLIAERFDETLPELGDGAFENVVLTKEDGRVICVRS